MISMKKKLKIVLMILGLILILVILNSVFIRRTTPLIRDDLELDIRIPRDVYEVGELFNDAEYFMKYEGEPFRGIILYGESREGFERVFYSITRGTIVIGDFDDPDTLVGLKVALRAFKLDENGYIGSTDYFYDEGTYIYSISVYDCDNLDTTFGTDNCGGWPLEVSSEEIVDKLLPLKTKSKSIKVSNE